MSTVFIFSAGIVVFALVTLASLWAGYLVFQRAWVVDNPDLPQDEDNIRPLVGRYKVLQSHRSASPAPPTTPR